MSPSLRREASRVTVADDTGPVSYTHLIIPCVIIFIQCAATEVHATDRVAYKRMQTGIERFSITTAL